jgi:uncharacterized protein YndB with AHSA1/START domain
MPEESNTITIARPVGDVFAFLADAENDKQWRGGVIEMTRTSGQGAVRCSGLEHALGVWRVRRPGEELDARSGR